jgi:hypothetical protein
MKAKMMPRFIDHGIREILCVFVMEESFLRQGGVKLPFFDSMPIRRIFFKIYSDMRFICEKNIYSK